MSNNQCVENSIHSNLHFWELLTANYYMAIAVTGLIRVSVQNFHKSRRTFPHSDRLFSGQQLTLKKLFHTITVQKIAKIV